MGVFITHELASFAERLSLGQEAGARPTLPRLCGLGGSVHLSVAIDETSVGSAIPACHGDRGAHMTSWLEKPQKL